MTTLDWYFDFVSPFSYLNDPGLFRRGELARAGELPDGIQRRT